MLRPALLLALMPIAFGCSHSDPDEEELPEQGFAMFSLQASGGPCAEGQDCSDTYTVLYDGRFEHDDGTADLSSADLERSIAVLTDETLVGILRDGPTGCEEVFDISERLTLVIDAETLTAEVIGCDHAVITDVNDLFGDLIATYIDP